MKSFHNFSKGQLHLWIVFELFSYVFQQDLDVRGGPIYQGLQNRVDILKMMTHHDVKEMWAVQILVVIGRHF